MVAGLIPNVRVWNGCKCQTATASYSRGAQGVRALSISSLENEGRRHAVRRDLVAFDAAPACWIASKPEPRNALRRATAGLLAGGPFFSGTGASLTACRSRGRLADPDGFLRRSPVPSQPNYRQPLLVGTDGGPRPPESCLRGRPRAPHPVPLQKRLMRAPPRGQDGVDMDGDGNFVKNKIRTRVGALLFPPPSGVAAQWGGWRGDERSEET